MTDFLNEERRVLERARQCKADKIFLVTDTNVAPLIDDLLPEVPRIPVKAGETHKNLQSAVEIWEYLSTHRATRKTLIVNVGGGMVSDLGGFVASTFKRGIPYINMPTTLLAAVDASIGGKTAVDFMGLKNEIGTFYFPECTIPLTGLFESLPEEEWLSGCGEVLKTAILMDDGLYEKVATEAFIRQRRPDLVREAVERCAAFKEQIVANDPEDRGERRILNFGHTFGHALESLMMEKDTPIPHGIAVAHGILYALNLSIERYGTGEKWKKSFEEILEKYFPPLELSESDRSRIKELMGHDKKNAQAGKPAFILIDKKRKRSTHIDLDSLN